MKKLIALLLALTLVVAFAGCEKKEENKLPPVEALTALKTLTEAYNTKYAETEYQLPLAGGGYENQNWEGADSVATTEVDFLTATMVMPEGEISKISAAASAFHAMFLNNFCAGAYNLIDGADYAAFAAAIKDEMVNHQWVCGTPQKIVIANVGDCVIAVYGNGELVEKFSAVIGETYAGAPILYNENIG